MKGPCPYCAQTDTRKDRFGYCKKHRCFEVSGTGKRYREILSELGDLRSVPNHRRNWVDGTYYNPREERGRALLDEMMGLVGHVPLEAL